MEKAITKQAVIPLTSLIMAICLSFLPTNVCADNIDAQNFKNVNLLGIKIGTSSSAVKNILENRYEKSNFKDKYEISGATGEKYVDRIEVVADETSGRTIDNWLILFTDQTIGGSAVFINRTVKPITFINTQNVIDDLIDKYGPPTIFAKMVLARKLIRIKWHYSSTGVLMSNMPDSKKCVQVFTETLGVKDGCNGKDVDVEIATNADGELLERLSINIRDYDLENIYVEKARIGAMKVKKAFLDETKRRASEKTVNF